MKLISARVTNFRSVEDSGEFMLDRATCLVGKNEAGKTAILSALAGLSPYEDVVTFDKERDYPRRFLAEYDNRHADKEAVVVTTRWELDDAQVSAVAEQFGAEALTSRVVTISRSYGDTGPAVLISLNEADAIKHFMAEERLNAAEAAALSRATTSSGLRATVKAIAEPTEKQTRIIARLDALPGKSVTNAIGRVVRDGLPQFMYFSHYDRMEGQLQLSTFEQRRVGQAGPAITPGEKVFIDFLEYAGTSLKEINEANTYEGLNARCEAASNRITEQLLEYWTQNPHLDIDVRVTKGDRLKTFATVVGADEADVEDIFSPATYSALINAAFHLDDAELASAEGLAAADDKTTRLVKQAEAHFRTLSPDTPEFDHYTPADWLIRNPAFLSEAPGAEATLERAKKVIAAVNGMLPR